MTELRRILRVVGITLVVLMMAGCFGGNNTPMEEPVVIRTPRPTFTPTPVVPTPPPPPPIAVNTPVPNTGGAAPTAVPGAPIAVVNDEQVNIRRTPTLDEGSVIQLAARGDQFTIVGKSSDDEWWQVCCVEGTPAWVYFAYVDTSGPVDGVPVTDGSAPAAVPPTQPPAPAATPVAAAQPVAPEPVVPTAPAAPSATPPEEAVPTPGLPFSLVAQEQFPESNNLVRIFLYVYQGNQALEGFTLKVTKDGAELPVTGVSSVNAGMTWPVADPRQRFQNMKVEFPNIQAAGSWQVQLVDGSGAPVGAPATFSLSATDTNRELYVRYERQ